MASGIVHNKDAAKVAAISFIPLIVVGVLIELTLPLLMTLVLSSLAGLFLMTPDLDQNTPIKSQNVLLRWCSPLGYANLFFWHRYARSFKHRSWYTHFPGIGTVLRLLYLFAVLNLYVLIFNGAGVSFAVLGYSLSKLPWIIPDLYLLYLYSFPIFINDIIHWIRDDCGHISLRNSTYLPRWLKRWAGIA